MKCVHTFLGNVNEMLILCYIFKLLKKKKITLFTHVHEYWNLNILGVTSAHAVAAKHYCQVNLNRALNELR